MASRHTINSRIARDWRNAMDGVEESRRTEPPPYTVITDVVHDIDLTAPRYWGRARWVSEDREKPLNGAEQLDGCK